MKINVFCSQPTKPENFVDGVKVSSKQPNKVAVNLLAENSLSVLSNQIENATSSKVSVKFKGTLSADKIESLTAVLKKAVDAGKVITVKFKKDHSDFEFECTETAKLQTLLVSSGIKVAN